jgi:histidyl-tRNA synthetase
MCEARAAGLCAQMEMGGRSRKGQLKQAHRQGARFAAIVGPEQTLLRDMQGGTEETLDTDKLLHAALRGLRELA